MQEEAFYVLDVGDIISKHNQWQKKLPRVEPHYGKKLILCTLFAMLTTMFDMFQLSSATTAKRCLKC
jgi:ornithine decarboxylase